MQTFKILQMHRYETLKERKNMKEINRFPLNQQRPRSKPRRQTENHQTVDQADRTVTGRLNCIHCKTDEGNGEEVSRWAETVS